MGGTAINIAHGYRDAAASGTVKMGGGAEERQGVGTTLILAALPFCNVVEDVGGIFVCSLIDGGVNAQLHANLRDGAIGKAGLEAEAG